MSISNELRGRYVDNHRRERIEASAISEDDRGIIQRAEQLIEEGRSLDVGAGKSADVIMLDIFEKQVHHRWVIKKQTERRGKQQMLGMTFEDELRVQDRSYSLIEAAKRQHPDKAYASIPRPYSLLRDEKNTWLIMECIEGETLLERALRTFIASHTDEMSPWSSSELANMRKDELIAAASHPEIINLLPPRYLEEINAGGELDDEHFIGIALQANRFVKGASQVLTPEQYDAIKNTVDELHRNGIYHRDLHASNIMVNRDGGVVILDFGTAIIRSREEVAQGNNVYTIKMDDDGTRYRTITDENMLADYEKVTRKVK